LEGEGGKEGKGSSVPANKNLRLHLRSYGTVTHGF